MPSTNSITVIVRSVPPIVALTGPTGGQTGAYTYTVSVQVNDKPVSGASVILYVGSTRETGKTLSDGNAFFNVSFPSPGTYYLGASYDGTDSNRMQVTIV